MRDSLTKRMGRDYIISCYKWLGRNKVPAMLHSISVLMFNKFSNPVYGNGNGQL